jgi:hypothetical protein
VHQVARHREQERRGEAVLGERDRPAEHLLAGEPTVAIEQSQPAVDGTGHRRARKVAAQRHGGVTGGSQLGRIHA